MRVPAFQLDAFATRRLAGNPAAVVVLDRFPGETLMQAVAAENNLAEAAFLVPASRRGGELTGRPATGCTRTALPMLPGRRRPPGDSRCHSARLICREAGG